MIQEREEANDSSLMIVTKPKMNAYPSHLMTANK